MAESAFLAHPTWNPVEVALDPRVMMTASGVTIAYLSRKWAYRSFRNVFGVAAKGSDGKVHYYGVDASGATDTSKEVKGAFGKRLLFNFGVGLLGVLVIGRIQDANADYLADGLAADAFANGILILLNLE